MCFQNDSSSSLKAHGASNLAAGEQKENERSITPDELVVIEGQSVEESSEAGEATEEEETEVKDTQVASRGDEESVGSNPCSDFEEVKQVISRSENDITAPADDLVLTQLPPTNGLHRGRRVYSREFLMNLRDCPEALKKLPTISSDLADIIKPMASFKVSMINYSYTDSSRWQSLLSFLLLTLALLFALNLVSIQQW